MKIKENYVVVSPAYGRDYKSAKEASADFLSGKDFELNSVIHAGTYCSVRDFEPGIKVNVRYAKLRNVVTVTIPALAEHTKEESK